MKPLPLLLTLTLLAAFGALYLFQFSPPTTKQSVSTPLPEAPLPIDFIEPEIPDLQPPLLEGDLTPAPELITFVQEQLALEFTQPPIFTPVPAETLITTVEDAVSKFLPSEQGRDLSITCQRLGILPPFQALDHTLITILAGEMRGLITPKKNLIMHDFQASSPPEQAALVNLLAQRLLAQKTPFSQKGDSVDQLLARHLFVQSQALLVEREFRRTLPQYPASLNENLRESILLGLPSFFHELSTFAEFHLLGKLTVGRPVPATEVLDLINLNKHGSSRRLLFFPFQPRESAQASTLGSIPLYLILLEATDPTTARTLATALVNDKTDLTRGLFTWTLTFASEQSAPRVAELFRSYYSLRDSEKKIKIEVAASQVIITSRP